MNKTQIDRKAVNQAPEDKGQIALIIMLTKIIGQLETDDTALSKKSAETGCWGRKVAGIR